MSVNEPSQGSLDQQWYLLKGRDVLGPYAGHVIKGMLRDRQVGSDAMVALPGSPDWQPISVLTGGPGAAPQVPGTSAASLGAGYRHYAGFWIRVGAYLLDSLIIGIPLYAIVLIPLVASGASQDSMAAIGNGLGFLLALVFVFYNAFFNAGPWQATPGKRICNIHVIHESGARIGFGRAIGRAFAYWLDGLILYIGFMMAGWTKEKTALHDMICQTRVIHGRPGQVQEQLTRQF